MSGVSALSDPSNSSRNQSGKSLFSSVSLRHSTDMNRFTMDKLQFQRCDFVGREAELDTLRQCVVQAIANKGGDVVQSSDDDDDDVDASPARGALTDQKQVIEIEGLSGVGKSALASRIPKLLKEHNRSTLFVTGKFKEIGQAEHEFIQPYAAIVEACDELCAILLDIDGSNKNLNVKTVRAKLKDDLDVEELELLQESLPRLRALLRSPGDDVNEEEAVEEGIPTTIVNFLEVKTVFQNAVFLFLQSVSQLIHITILLDDVQWIDPASMQLIENLLVEPKLKSFLLAVTSRSEDMTEEHPFRQAIRRVNSSQDGNNSPSQEPCPITHIKLENLPGSAIEALLEDLITSTDQSLPELAKLIHSKTHGNIFFAKQYLELLTTKGLLSFNFGSMKWTWDIETIQKQTLATDNIVAMVTARLKDLPKSLQDLLPRVACLGSIFTMEALDLIMEHYCKDLHGLLDEYERGKSRNKTNHDGETASTFLDVPQILRHERLYWVDEDGVYRCEHDKIQEAILSLVAAEELVGIQFDVGLKLFKDLSPNQLTKHLFAVTSLLNSNAENIPSSDPKRIDIAHLNLRAGNVAFASAAFEAASMHLSKGLRLISSSDDSWTNNKKLCLDLSSGASEAFFCTAQHTRVGEIYEELSARNDVSLLDMQRVCNVQINSLNALGETTKALALTIELLKKLGCKLPKFQKLGMIVSMVRRTYDLISVGNCTSYVRFSRRVELLPSLFNTQIGTMATVSKSVAHIQELDRIQDPSKEWVVYLLDRAGIFAVELADQVFIPLIFLKGLRWTKDHGTAPYTSPILGMVGMLLLSTGDFAGARSYADLALTLAVRQNKARSHLLAYGFVMHCQIPLASCKRPLQEGYEIGMKTGDLEAAFWCLVNLFELSIIDGTKLTLVEEDLQQYVAEMERHKFTKQADLATVTWQRVFNLMHGGNKNVLDGEYCDLEKLTKKWSEKPQFALQLHHLIRCRAQCAFWFDDFNQVCAIMEENGYDDFLPEKQQPGILVICTVYIFCALSCVSVSRETTDKKKKSKRRKQALKFFSRISSYAKKGVVQVQHAEPLIEAELASLDGKPSVARSKYEVSILLAGRSGKTNFQALAHERCGAHAARQKDGNEARYHYGRALELYREWGAKGKARHLEEKVRGLMSEATEAFQVNPSSAPEASVPLFVPR